ncbi:hypothetical protein [Larkinella terrae]|uniref:Uncharacterized protein n=1 Tax=Larkinella terrae TaxID=2025311 RepID=A0A7K0EIN5_9BACT|nr:hypothetical protein [Larkinella terrae]MRS61667.1 hypothetical protein [Larkinella terrae]
MKALLLIAYTFLITSANAQDKIEGVGPFKIGKTKVSDLTGIAQSLGAKFEEVLPDTVEAIQKGKVGSHAAEGSLCPNTKKFNAHKLNVAGVNFNNVFLTFYRGNLVDFWSDGSSEIEQAFTEKYGSGKAKGETIATWRGKSVQADSRTDQHHYFNVSHISLAYEAQMCNRKAFEKVRSEYAKSKNNPLKDL